MEEVLSLQLILVMMGVSAGAGTHITCSAGEFSRCTNASVTCHFQENIKHSKKNFNIVQYPFNKGGSNSDSGTYVLVCNWGSNEMPECKTEAGYTFNRQVSDKVTLDIPDVTASVGGVYVCQVVPDSGVPLETCTLRVKNYEPPPMQNMCTPVNCGREDLTIVVLILLLILLSVVFVVVLIYFRKRYHLVRKPGDPAKDHCICCGSVFAIERRHPKQPSPTTTTPDAKEKVAPTRPFAATYVKSEARNQKGIEATEDAAPLLTAPETAQLVDTLPDKNDTKGFSKTYAGQRNSQPLPAAHQRQPRMDNARRPMSVQDKRQEPIYENDEDGRGSPPSYHDSEPTRPKEGQQSAHSQEQAKTAGNSTTRETERLKPLGYGLWTTDQVCLWLAQKQFDDGLIDKFRENKIVGEDLVKNKKKRWKNIGRDDKERNLIYAKIEVLQKECIAEKKLKDHEEKASKDSKKKSRK